MFLIGLKNLFKPKQRESSLIRGFDDALSWIKTYEKAEDYNQAIMAVRELTLKHKSTVNYYEEAARKLTVLEASNVKAVSDDAKAKIEKVNDFLETIYFRLTILEKRLKIIEQLKQKDIEAKRSIQQKRFLQTQIEEVEKLIGKKEYTKALGFAKKLVYDFQNDKSTLKLLVKIQRLYDGNKKNIERQEKQKERVDKTLEEIGVHQEIIKKEKKRDIPFAFVLDYFKDYKRKLSEKKVYLRRQGTLQSIEKMLLLSGSIDNISSLDSHEEDLFSVINSGLTKDVGDFNMYGFNTFGRIMGKDKIIGDTFGYYKTDDNKTIFYFGDATGHGVQAGFTVAVLSKLFFDLSKKTKNLAELFTLLNNGLKERIKGKSFITAVVFEWDSKKNVLRFIGAGHDPLYVYRRETGEVEKIIPGGLALGVRLINNPSSVKIRDLDIGHEDVMLGYTDGIIEARNVEGKMFTLDRLEKSFKKAAMSFVNPQKIYELIFKDITTFQEGRVFDDDTSAFIFTRDTNRDLIENEQELKKLLEDVSLKKLTGDFNAKNKTRQEIVEQARQQKYDRDVQLRLDRLDRLYKIGEYIKLKQEVILYYREGFVHDKMRFYLEKAIENEYHTTIKKHEDKLHRKYETLSDLYKKGEYEIVVKEALDVIFKNGKI